MISGPLHTVKDILGLLSRISLSKAGQGIELVISDDGVGMDVDQVLPNSTARSLGLISMRERAEYTGGRLSIQSSPGEGTIVRAYWAKGDSF